MTIVATKDKYKLEHTVIDGTFGQPDDFFEIIWVDEKGMKYHAPISKPIRLNLTNLMFEPLRNYTEEEYMDILERGLKYTKK